MTQARRNGITRARRRGVGLVELLVALSISASLLTATAVAIDAAFKAYAVNQEHSDLTQRARLAVYRITTLVRQSELHAPDDAAAVADFSKGKTVTGLGISMYDLQDNTVTFRYDPKAKRVLAIVNNVPHTLCEGVEAFSIRMEPMRSPRSLKSNGPWDLMRRATFLITVRTTQNAALPADGVGRQWVTISASVMPRRNTW